MYQWLRSSAKNLDPLASDLLKMFDGWKAFKESDEDMLIRIFETAAKTGRPEYQCDLGYIYRNGFDWECKSIDESDEWFRLAADQGCAGAFYGMAYYGRSEKESSRLYRMAAELGDSSAQYEIGCKLSWPNNSDEDKAVAVGWFRKAAEQGNYRAQN